MTRRDLTAAIGLALVAVGIVYGLAQITWADLASSPGLSINPAAVLLLLFPVWVAAQMFAYWVHARGIRQGNFARIHGKGTAVVLLVAAVLVTIGGGR